MTLLNPLPISQFRSSAFTFSSLPDMPLNKTNVGLPRSRKSWERAIMLFASLAFRAGSQQWCLGRWCTMVSPVLLQLSSTGAFQTVFSSFLHQNFSFLTQLLGCGDRVCAVDVQPPFCLLPLLSLQSWHFMKCMDVSSCSWDYGSTYSLTGFYERKRQNFCTDKDQKKSWILSAISRNLLWHDHKSRKWRCSRKKQCSSLWWTVSDEVKANNEVITLSA